MTEVITLGNVLTIISIILAAAIHIIIVSNKLSSFMATTSERLNSMDAKLKETTAICQNCYLKSEMNSQKADIDNMKFEQTKLKAELPLKLDAIEKELREIKDTIKHFKIKRKEDETLDD